MDSRASETHRARSIKQLIQNGKDWARIKVTLKNEGDEAYKPETYGKRIVIQRELNRHSAHKYSLISERGKIISNRREDLDKILHHFSIKVTNPCVLLTQDDARDLIGGTDPRKMYEFFLRATGLREMKDDISAIQSKVDSMERMIESENIKIKDFELKAAEAEKEYKTCEHIQDLDNKLLKTRKMLLWSKVGEFEEELSELESNLEKVSKRKEQYSQRLAQPAEIDQKSLNRKMKDEMTPINDQIKAKRAERREVLQQLKNFISQESKLQREVSRSKKCISRNQKRIQSFKKEIRGIENNKSRNKEKQKREEQRNQAEQELQKLRTSEKEGKEKMEEMRRNNPMKEIGPKLSRLNQEMKFLNPKLVGAKNNLSHYERANGGGNRLASFGRYSVQVDQEIQRNRRRFRKLPLGPLGQFIKVKSDQENQKHLLCIEECLGRFMDAYVCDNYHDSGILKGILKKFYSRFSPMIITQRERDQTYKVPANRERLPNIYSMLEFTNPWAHNVIVDQCKPERWYVSSSGNEGYDFVQRVRCNGAMAMEKDARSGKNLGVKVQRTGGSGAIRSFFGRERVKYLALDYTIQIKETKAEIHNLDQKLKQVKKEMFGLQRERKNYDKGLSKLEEQWNATVKSIRKTEQKIEELSIVEDEDPSGELDMVAAIRSQIDNCEAEIERSKEKIETETEQLKKLKTKAEIKKNRAGEIKQECEELEGKIQDIEAKYVGLIEEMTRKKAAKKKNAEKLKKFVDLENQLTQEVESKRETIRRTTEAATKHMAIRPEGKFPSRTKLARKEQALLKQLEREKRKHGDFFTAEAAYDKAVEDLKEANEDLRLSRELLEKEKEIYKDRRENWKDFRRVLQTEVNTHFNRYLTRQGHTGQLHFCTKEKELTIEVIPAHQEEKTVTKALSGGEKSFTTIAFILAFGSTFDAPFRAMDEFDIFMDSVNRKISMGLLIKEASSDENQRNQYIFLTPQDINGIPRQSNIRIHKLAAVDRGQQYISFPSNRDA